MSRSSGELNLRSPPSTILFVSNKGSMEVDTSLHPKHTLTAQLTSVQKSIRILFESNNNRQKSSGDLGQKQRRNSSDFSVIILFESNNNRPKKPD